ncbi:MAG: helix-turn-helix domain-containing protein [Lachnospiraceae bacterium]|nr:helix-turn-helix domain-containing protein [Lachnospiraceae bacterium]
MDFGSKLKYLRTSSGMTQKQLAERIGVTKSVISFYELRERTPSPDVLIKLSDIFRVSTDYLLGIERNDSVDISELTEKEKNIVRALVAALKDNHN